MIKFFKHIPPVTKLEKNVIASLSGYNLKGDFMFGEPDISAVFNYAQTVVREIMDSSPKSSLINSIKVTLQEGKHVIVEFRGGYTGKEYILCSFQTI